MADYSTLLRHRKWCEKRKIILLRDGDACRICGSGKNLQIHHRQYHINRKTKKFILPWNYKIKFLLTLCSSCHQKGHSLLEVPKFKI